MSKAAPAFRSLVGTSEALEKPYLRLTGGEELRPEQFRPRPVLERSLSHCLKKYRATGDYSFISDQLRSIRQDLTVQHIHERFTFDVYLTTIELATEKGDWDNFVQAIDQVWNLLEFATAEERAAMGGLCLLYQLGVGDLSGATRYMLTIDENIIASPSVQFALEAWQAMASGDLTRWEALRSEADPAAAAVMIIGTRTLAQSTGTKFLINVRGDTQDKVDFLRELFGPDVARDDTIWRTLGLPLDPDEEPLPA